MHDRRVPRSKPSKELLHLVARTQGGVPVLRHRAFCSDLWRRIATHFDVVACVLMPDHVHVLVQVERDRALYVFSAILSAFRRRVMRVAAGAPDVPDFEWERVPHPEKVQYDKRHIARTVRYIHLNPCRDALCDDPLQWEWSTHRDWVGAVARPIVDIGRWSRALGWSTQTCARRLHAYVCTDPSVRRESALPDSSRFASHENCDASLYEIAVSVPVVLRSGSSTPAEFSSQERLLSIHAAGRWTRYRAPQLALWIGCHSSTVRRMLSAATNSIAAPGASAPAPYGLGLDEERALAMTLSDARLRPASTASACSNFERLRAHNP